MPRITDIKPQKRKQRYNIFIDGRFAFGLDTDNLVKYNLKTDQEIAQEKIERLVKEDDYARVYNNVLKFLSYRPRSNKEVNDWFLRKGIGEDTKKLVINKLKELKFIDDIEFTKWWIQQRTTYRPLGLRLLSLELRKKGIARELIEEQIDLLKNNSISESEIAWKLVADKLKKWSDLEPQEFRKKVTSFLARRGYSWGVIEEVLSKIKEEL